VLLRRDRLRALVGIQPHPLHLYPESHRVAERSALHAAQDSLVGDEEIARIVEYAEAGDPASAIDIGMAAERGARRAVAPA
jgi:hypothetical protein